ncbi:MAG: HEPN domain-containing protein [Candidatus Nitrosocaldus sp.]
MFMVFIPIDFLDLAEYLYKFSPSPNINREAMLRTVISRSYYSAFLYAREFLKHHTSSNITYSTRDHSIIRELLVNIGLITAANILKYLRHMRNDADYNLNTNITECDASDAIINAKQVVDIIRKKIGDMRP